MSDRQEGKNRYPWANAGELGHHLMVGQPLRLAECYGVASGALALQTANLEGLAANIESLCHFGDGFEKSCLYLLEGKFSKVGSLSFHQHFF